MSPRERFLAACACKRTDRPPIWIMRQAGRYLPEYRQLKTKYNFVELISTPELATEVSLQPLERFALDAAILFSDILVIPEAMGQPYHFSEGKGIAMDFALDSPAAIAQLETKAVGERLSYVPETLRLLREALGEQKALIGFGGAPWTLAAYMVEGGGSVNFERLKALAYAHPVILEQLLEKLTQALIQYFRLQITAGADAIQIFDSCAGLCPGPQYEELSLKWIRRIIAAMPKGFPIILFARGMTVHAKTLAKTGARVLSLDWTAQLEDVREQVESSIALQGNLDPTVLNTKPEVVVRETERLLFSMQGSEGYIFNLGHGILPEAKLENVETLVDTVKGFRNYDKNE